MAGSDLPTRPFLAIYVIWHPSFGEGGKVAEFLYNHFRREIFSNIAGGTGLSVTFRYEPPPGAGTPIDIDFDSAETTAIVALVDDALVGHDQWLGYLKTLSQKVKDRGLRARLFPVTFTRNAMYAADLPDQAIRIHDWSGLDSSEKTLRLKTELSHQFCRMLRHYLEGIRHPEDRADALERYLKPVQVFLSHSKHDNYGERLAKETRDYLHNETEFGSFFDVRNIPPGLHFDDVLNHYVRVSSVIVFHTDSYSSREWCRREVLEAKKHNVPLVVANAIVDREERGFPYMGNVPTVRLDWKSRRKRMPAIVGFLLDEVLKDFLWRCRVELVRKPAGPCVHFLPRPPELISVAALAQNGTDLATTRIVYPDPPIGIEEAKLFSAISPTLLLQSYTEWLGEFGAQDA